MLTFAWFLAAGMKWSSEAIGSYSSYMHLISWILPAVKTIIIISTSSVDGDPFLGVCGVGNTNINNLHIFILAPLGKFLKSSKVECVIPMVVVSILSHVEFGRNDHRKDAPHFTIPSIFQPSSN